MATGTAAGTQTVKAKTRTGIFTGRKGRKLKEALLGYLFLAPAFIIIFTFGLFPLAFSAYQSTLRGINKIVGQPDGLGNYVKAIDNLAYVLMFWIAVVFVYLAIKGIVNTVRLARKYDENPWYWLLPASVTAVGLALFARFFFTFLPRMLEVPSHSAAWDGAYKGIVLAAYW